MKRRALSFLSVVLAVLLVFAQPALAKDATASPSDFDDLHAQADAFLQENIDLRSATFTIDYGGAWLAKTFRIEGEGDAAAIVPDDPYLSTLDPLIDRLYLPPNDYAGLALKPGDSFTMQAASTTLLKALTGLKLTYDIVWGETAEETKAVEDYAKGIVAQVCKPGMSDYEKVLALHDHVVNAFSYDTSGVDRYPSDLLSDGKGLCGSYSGMMWQLLTAAGIDCRVIRKDSSAGEDADRGRWIDHGWNLVLLDGNWYHLDATWDDPVTTNGKPMLLHDYFLKSDATMAATHQWDRSIYPAAPADYAGQVGTQTAAKVSTAPFPTGGGGTTIAGIPVSDLVKIYGPWALAGLVLVLVIVLAASSRRRKRK